MDSYLRKGWIEADDQQIKQAWHEAEERRDEAEERRAEVRANRSAIHNWLIGDNPFIPLPAEEQRERAGRGGFIVAMTIWAVLILAGFAVALSGPLKSPVSRSTSPVAATLANLSFAKMSGQDRLMTSSGKSSGSRERQARRMTIQAANYDEAREKALRIGMKIRDVVLFEPIP